jgi:hypothetical protein
MPIFSTGDPSARDFRGAPLGLARIYQVEEDGADRAFLPW